MVDGSEVLVVFCSFKTGQFRLKEIQTGYRVFLLSTRYNNLLLKWCTHHLPKMYTQQIVI